MMIECHTLHINFKNSTLHIDFENNSHTHTHTTALDGGSTHKVVSESNDKEYE